MYITNWQLIYCSAYLSFILITVYRTIKCLSIFPRIAALIHYINGHHMKWEWLYIFVQGLWLRGTSIQDMDWLRKWFSFCFSINFHWLRFPDSIDWNWSTNWTLDPCFGFTIFIFSARKCGLSPETSHKRVGGMQVKVKVCEKIYFTIQIVRTNLTMWP